jgi:FtsZ-interacting cell division protein ZipA
MELLETQDPEKKKLIETSERHKRELEKEIHEMSDKTERTLKNALIIGGTLAVVYLIVSNINTSKKKRKKVKEDAAREGMIGEEADDDGEESSVSGAASFISQVGERLTAQATAMLLEMAKDKLAEYLNKRKQ